MKKRQQPRKQYSYWWLIGILAVIVMCIVVAIIRYRSSLESPDPRVSGKILVGESIHILDIHICLPSSNSAEFTWKTERVIPERTDRSSLLELAITTWGRGMLDIVNIDSGLEHVLEHCFIDDRGVAYIDFDGRFMDVFPSSTTSEMQLLASLYRTVQSNIHSVRRIEILRDGTPVSSWGGHLLIDQSRNQLPFESLG